MEIWKPTVGFEESYEDSNHGRIRSVDRITTHNRHIKGVVLKPTSNGQGYPCVSLYSRGKRKLMPVHRAVAVNHVAGYKVGLIVNHIDYDITNNHHSNLEWVTHKENTRHSKDRMNAANVKANAKTYLVTFPCNTEKVVYNLSKFCREQGLSVSNMVHVSSGVRKHHKGFRCKLLEATDERRVRPK